MSTMADGIYFNMPEEQYLAEERLSKSGIKRLRVSPADYWAESHLNPNPPEITPEQERQRHIARLIGRAYHCARLEPERYVSTYVREITQADFAGEEGFLTNATGIERELAALGLPKKYKEDNGVLDQAKRLAAAGYDKPIWHVLEDEWRSTVQPGQVVIPAKAYDEIVIDMERIRAVPAVAKLLTGGAPEVSVFWTDENGIKMKARFDYLKPDRWVEFKTFANSSRKALNQCLTDAIRFGRYHIDVAGYMEAAEAIRGNGLDIIGTCTDEERAIIEAIQLKLTELRCHFVFQQKGGVPNILEREWQFFDGVSETAVEELEAAGATEDRIARAKRMQAMSSRPKTAIYVKGRLEIAAAKRDWLAYSEIYERGQPWLPFNPSGTISDADFSQYFLEEAI